PERDASTNPCDHPLLNCLLQLLIAELPTTYTTGLARLKFRQECSQERRAPADLVDFDMLMVGVGAVAGHAKPVKGGDAQRTGEVAVAAAARPAFVQFQAELTPDGLGAPKEVKRGAPFERGPVPTAADAQARAGRDRL